MNDSKLFQIGHETLAWLLRKKVRLCITCQSLVGFDWGILEQVFVADLGCLWACSCVIGAYGRRKHARAGFLWVDGGVKGVLF